MTAEAENASELPPDDESTECDREITFRIRRRISGGRLDKYLHGRLPRISRSVLQRLIRDGGVTVNGLPTKASHQPETGDLVKIIIPPPPPTDVVPEDIPIDVIYEDDYMLAINKQVGIICHPARYGQTGTLANALSFYAHSLSRGDDPFRPGIIHRLDKNTTGVMLVAKTDEAHWRLALQFERRSIRKEYIAIVEGSVNFDSNIIDKPLAEHPMVKDRYIVAGREMDASFYKEAVTEYQVVERFKGYSLVKMFPRTGRTHQLRVHMSSLGHPMVGDTLYGGHLVSELDLAQNGLESPLIHHQCLHARRIEFTHPILETRKTIEAPLPLLFETILDLMRTHRSLGDGKPK